MEHYAVTETQLNTNGAISHLSLDHGTDKAAALSHYHNALASLPVSLLVAGTVMMNVIDDVTGSGYTMSETIKGTGVLE